MTARGGTVAAIAGRRIDKAGAPPRFPAGNETLVAERLRAVLIKHAVEVVVSSAACGTDLVALEVAGALGLRRIVFLPHERATFRERSVVDRAPDAGPRFDRVIKEVLSRGDLGILTSDAEDDGIYRDVNEAIVAEAAKLADASAGRLTPLAVVVWNGQSRGAGDLTDHFRRTAEARGFKIESVGTLA